VTVTALASMSDPSTRYTIDPDRLWASIMEMAAIGGTPRGGVNRLALTETDRRARDLFATWCEAAGCRVSVDGAGNMFARRPGRRAAPPVGIGSHLDTQPTGGKFDGIYGVMAGLEVVRTPNDRGIATESPIEIVNWTNEEGARFAPVMLGSGTFAGVYPLAETRARRDSDGVTFGEALDGIGYAGDAAFAEGHPLAAFIEAHIEQGPLLERAGMQVGVVTGAQGIVWYDIHVEGRESHAGTTPMEARHDALVAAAGVVRAADGLARANGPAARITAGDLRVHPCARNTIPGRVDLTVDLRDPDADRIARLDAELRDACAKEEKNLGVAIACERISYTAPVAFDDGIVASVRDAAERAGIAHMDIISGAGHDACHIAQLAPTGMVFVPCRDGLSHNEAESAEPDDLAAGCEVLYRAALATAGPAA